jgi:hypothetical protein
MIDIFDGEKIKINVSEINYLNKIISDQEGHVAIFLRY